MVTYDHVSPRRRPETRSEIERRGWKGNTWAEASDDALRLGEAVGLVNLGRTGTLSTAEDESIWRLGKI